MRRFIVLASAWNRFMVYTAGGLEIGEMNVTGNYASRGEVTARLNLKFSGLGLPGFWNRIKGGVYPPPTSRPSPLRPWGPAAELKEFRKVLFAHTHLLSVYAGRPLVQRSAPCGGAPASSEG